MATYHLTVKNHSRSKNANGVALASYRSGERLWDEHQQSFKDCRNYSKSDVLYTELMNNGNMTREQLWNTAEKSENRKNSVVAREIEIALPYEVSNEERIDLTREFSRHLARRYNCAVDLAVHAPDMGGDERNYHAHILMTTREVSSDGLGPKWRQLNQPNGAGRIELSEIRETFSKMQNRTLEKAAVKDRVSAKKCSEQDRPKKYQVLPFKKYQVMRREGRVEDYKEVSGVEEFDRFKKWKEIEIEDLMGQITFMKALEQEAIEGINYYDPIDALIDQDLESWERQQEEQESLLEESVEVPETAKINIELEGQADGIYRDQSESRGRAIGSAEQIIRQETSGAEDIDGGEVLSPGEEEYSTDETYQRFKHDFGQADRRNRNALKEPDESFEQSIILSCQRASEELRQQGIRDLLRSRSLDKRLRNLAEQSEELMRQSEQTRRSAEQTAESFTGGREQGVRQRVRDGVRQHRAIEGLRRSLGRISQGIKDTYSRFTRAFGKANGQLDAISDSGTFKDTVKRVIKSIKSVFSRIDKDVLEDVFEPLAGKTEINTDVGVKMPEREVREDVKIDFSFEDLELTKSQRYQSKLKWEEAKRRTEREQRSSQKDRGRGMRR